MANIPGIPFPKDVRVFDDEEVVYIVRHCLEQAGVSMSEDDLVRILDYASELRMGAVLLEQLLAGKVAFSVRDDGEVLIKLANHN